MKLKLKLPLAFAMACALLFVSALFGLFKLSGSITHLEKQIHHDIEVNAALSDTAVAFGLTVQDWENTLLRGADPKALDKFWTAHLKAMQTPHGQSLFGKSGNGWCCM